MVLQIELIRILHIPLESCYIFDSNLNLIFAATPHSAAVSQGNLIKAEATKRTIYRSTQKRIRNFINNYDPGGRVATHSACHANPIWYGVHIS